VGVDWRPESRCRAVFWNRVISPKGLATSIAPKLARATARSPRRIRRAWEGIFSDAISRFEPAETIAAGDRVVQLWRYSWDGDLVATTDAMSGPVVLLGRCSW